MSFISQSIKNKFPSWSKVRRDRSSNFGIILDCIGEELELLRRNGYALKLQQKNLLSTPSFEKEKIFKFQFNEDETYDSENKNKNITNIVCENEETSIDIFFNWNKYSFAYPNKFKVKEATVSVFEEKIYGNQTEETVFEKPKQLYLNLENVKSFNNVKNLNETKKYCVILRGKNSIEKDIEERINITDLKIYKTINYFKSLNSIERTNSYLNRPSVRGGDAIEIFGLDLHEDSNEDNDSYIIISECYFKVKRDQIKSDLSVSDTNPFADSLFYNEANARNELFVEFSSPEVSEGETKRSYLDFFHKYFRNENISLTVDSKIENDFFEEFLYTCELAKENGDPCDISDWSVDQRRSKIITLGKDKVIRYYPIETPKIVRDDLITESKEIEIVLETAKSFYNLNEEVGLNISLERPKGMIGKYCVIKHISFAESFSFLNKENEWQDEVFLFKGNNFDNVFENIKPSLYVKDTFDDYGQINYYVCSFRQEISYSDKVSFVKKINSKILNDSKGIFSNKTSIVCKKSLPDLEINVSEFINDETVSISLQGIDNLLFVKDGNRFFTLEEVRDIAYFSQNLESIYLENKYTESLKLFIEYTEGSPFETSLDYDDTE